MGRRKLPDSLFIKRNYALPKPLIERLDAESAEQGVPGAELLRRALADYFLRLDRYIPRKSKPRKDSMTQVEMPLEVRLPRQQIAA